jgi:F-type H+-transporting ATPase subunit delta
MPQAVTERYARALADAIERQGNYREVADEVRSFAGAYAESLELHEVLESPAVLPQAKLRVLDRIMERLALSSVVQNFLRVLQSRYRLHLIGEIQGAFSRVADERMGVVRIAVFSASRLSAEQQSAVENRFVRLTQKTPAIEYRVDPDLLGGVRAEIHSTVYDGTIRGSLDRIRAKLETAQE